MSGGYRTPLGRVRGLGSAKHGVGHFIGQRVSAVALVFLLLWGVWSALHQSGDDYRAAAEWAHEGLNPVLLVLLIGAAFFHMSLGLRTVIEDYVHQSGAKAVLLILNQFVCWAGAAIGVISVLKVAFGVGAY